MRLTIAISSGKGGTGKTFISTNIAKIFEQSKHKVCYIDCDVEEPNGHLFLKPEINKKENIYIKSPADIDNNKCISCGKCAKACNYNAITIINKKTLLFQNLCHTCGACMLVCPVNAVIENDREIGEVFHGNSGNIQFNYAALKTAEAGMSPRLIRKIKESTIEGINLLDSPPGTACTVVETVKDADLVVLVTDPTPFGINDLKLSVDMCRKIGKEPVVLINRADYMDNKLKEYCKKEFLEIIGEIPDKMEVAQCYSEGNLVIEKLRGYKAIFQKIAKTILDKAKEERIVKYPQKLSKEKDFSQKSETTTAYNTQTKELVIISGKGGTGKTSIAASFCALEKNMAIADCDVDAADLHLILNPTIQETGVFIGGTKSSIDTNKCTKCGKCFNECRFDAIEKQTVNGEIQYSIDEISCEGCGVCAIVCDANAINSEPAVNGEWYISKTRFGPMSHAKLGVAEENSGKLVTLVKKNKDKIAGQNDLNEAIIDGSPGTGCPVIASITGASYAVIVTEPTVSGVHDLKRILDLTNYFKVKSGVIVNKYDINPDKTKEIELVTNNNNSSILGVIPYDKIITKAQVKGLSVIEYSKNEISQQIHKIWKKVRAECFSR